MRALIIMAVLLLTHLLTPSQTTLAQDTPPAPDFLFTPHAQNPVLDRGAAGAWDGDCGTIYAPQVVEQDGVYYLFYTGSCDRGGRPSAIGVARSDDGVTWTRSDQNPILTPDSTGHDAMCVSAGVPFVDGDTWTLYYAANSQPCAGPGRYIGRATAPTPDGPWQRDSSPVLEAGSEGAWDSGFIMPHTVLRTDDGYVLFYSAGEEFLVPLPRRIGMATSADGIHWTKFDDPTTTEAPYAESDPLLAVGADGALTPFEVWTFDVLHTEDGWEMFYSATCPRAADQTCPGFIAYAHSHDGIHWQTYAEPDQWLMTPLTIDQSWAEHCLCYPSALRHDDEYWLYFTGCADAMNDCKIGLATGTVNGHE